MWKPDPNEPQPLDWWRPLLAAARAAREEAVPWPIHIDEFELVGRVSRQRRPGVWIYRHCRGGELLIDDFGRPQRFIEYSTGRQPGRFQEIDIRRAVWAAGLPDVVEPVWYEPPHRAPPLPEPVIPGERRLRLVH